MFYDVVVFDFFSQLKKIRTSFIEHFLSFIYFFWPQTKKKILNSSESHLNIHKQQIQWNFSLQHINLLLEFSDLRK